MRILQMVAQTVIGGAENYGYMLSCRLAECGHSVRLISTRDNGPLLDRDRPPGLEVEALPRSGRSLLPVARYVHRHLEEFRPDVVHAHNFTANSWVRVLGRFRPRLAVVCHVHRGRIVTDQPASLRWADRWLFRRADLVLGLNEEMMAYLEKRLWIPANRLLFLPNGIDTDKFSVPATRSPASVVCVASLTEVKNHTSLLAAWPQVLREVPEARLTLVGEGPLRPVLEAQALDLGISQSLEFAGLQSDVVRYLRQASVFVLVSHREALPLALLEAMSTGAVPVVSAVGGMPEIVADGTSGLLVSPEDVGGIADRLVSLLRDGEVRARMSGHARSVVESRYGLSGVVDRLVDAYGEAIARRSRKIG